jgi:hypothetical protein
MALEYFGNQLDQSLEKCSSITQSHGGEEYLTYNKRMKANWIGNVLRMNCLLKHVIEGKIEEGYKSGKARKKT